MVPIPLSNEEIDCSFIDSSDVLVILSHLDWIAAGLSTASSASTGARASARASASTGARASASASASARAATTTIRRPSTFRSLLFYNLVHTNFFITFHLFNHTHTHTQRLGTAVVLSLLKKSHLRSKKSAAELLDDPSEESSSSSL
jgi:hypothetical protein